ncbi:MAG: Ig-like domain-containing protein, partial [Gemmatimonadota bacterium]|nr:Ig-like domain-containing protein [Gemmatimonadota bacterium]
MPLPNPSRLSPAPRPLAAVAALSLAIACPLLPTLLPAEETLSVGPTVSLSGPTYTLGNHPYEVTITFSTPVTGFEQADVTVGNASVSAFSGSGASYSITITPSASGAVTVDVAANVATDTAGNGNSAATRYSATADLDPPSVQITGPSGTQTGAFTVSIGFSEAVGVHGHPFEQGDVTVGNGSVTGFSGSAASYSITVTPSATGTVTVSVAAGVARDAGGNANTASSLLSVQANLNSPPVITAPGNKTYRQGQAITAISIPVSDPDGDSFGMTIVGLPSGLDWSWDETSKSLQVTGTVASNAAAKAYTVTIEANEVNDGLKAEATFTITVTASTPPANSAPVITAPGDKTYQQGQAITAFGITTSDADNDEVTVTVTGLPSGLSYANGQVQGTVSASATAQAYTVTVSANDGVNTAVTGTFTITVTATPANSPPVITAP